MTTRPVADLVDPLVVMGLGHRQLGAGRLRGERTRRQPNVMLVALERAAMATVIVVVNHVRKMLDQRAATSDVEQLHAAADAECRDVALERACEQGELELVTHGHDPRGRRVSSWP